MGWVPPPPPVLPDWLTDDQRRAVLNLYRAELLRGMATQGGMGPALALALLAILAGIAFGVIFR